MSRKSLNEEMSNRKAAEQVLKSAVAAYPPPPYQVLRLKGMGIFVTRQYITRRYHEAEIHWSPITGLWMKKK